MLTFVNAPLESKTRFRTGPGWVAPLIHVSFRPGNTFDPRGHFWGIFNRERSDQAGLASPVIYGI